MSAEKGWFHRQTFRGSPYGVLPGFKSRNHGALVNIGSVIGFDGYPYAAIYGGTKAYVQNLTTALQAEMSSTNVVVQLVAPAATVSEIWDVQGFPLSNVDPSILMSTEDMVDAALVGWSGKKKSRHRPTRTMRP